MEQILVHDRIAQAYQLIQRLERISADSVWAHRSSGYRGSLLKWIEHAEICLSENRLPEPAESQQYKFLFETGLRLLASAAHENIRKRGFKR